MRPTFTRLAVAASAVGLVAGGAGAFAAPNAPSATPTLKATIANHKLTVVGSSSFAAGQLDVSLTAVDTESEVGVFRLHPGYTFQALRNDVQAFGASYNKQGQPSKAGLKHLRHAISNTTSYGGLDVEKGKTDDATLLIPKAAGTYVIFNDSDNLPKQPTTLTVTAASGPQSLPKADASVVAKTDKRFGGASTLPAQGIVRFKNISTESPHFMYLQHAKKGTTRKEVIASVEQQGKPKWALSGAQGTDFLSTNGAMNVQLNLPAGTYALMCFFPDPNTGQPHAAMGMVEMVTLK